MVIDQGNNYPDARIDIGSGMDFCTEHSVIAAMMTTGKYPIAMIVAVWKNQDRVFVLSPRRRYRKFIRQIDAGPAPLGYSCDPRLSNALAIIREKQDDHGRWPLEYNYTGKTWVGFGAKKQPNKWVTIRALRVLKAIGMD